MIKSRKRRPPQHSEVRIGVLTVVPTPGCESLKCSAGRIISSSCSAPIAQRQIASHGLCANLELTLECVNKNGGSTLPGKGFPWRFHYSLSFDAGEDCLHRRGPSCLSRRPTSPIRPRDANYYDHTIPFAERMFCRFGNVACGPGGLEGVGQIHGKKRVARIVCLPHPADFIVKIRKGAELPTARQSPRQEKQQRMNIAVRIGIRNDQIA